MIARLLAVTALLLVPGALGCGQGEAVMNPCFDVERDYRAAYARDSGMRLRNVPVTAGSRQVAIERLQRARAKLLSCQQAHS